MFKLIVFVSLMFIATWSQGISKRPKRESAASQHFIQGTTVWGNRKVSCDSCGSECVSACGTKQFRACCFNYLKKKRVPLMAERMPTKAQNEIPENGQKQALPFFIIENLPEESLSSLISSEYKPYFFEDYV